MELLSVLPVFSLKTLNYLRIKKAKSQRHLLLPYFPCSGCCLNLLCLEERFNCNTANVFGEHSKAQSRTTMGTPKHARIGGNRLAFCWLFFFKCCHIQHSSNEEFKKESSSRWCLLKLILSSRNFLLSSSFNQDMGMAYLIKMGLQDLPFLCRQRDKKIKPAHVIHQRLQTTFWTCLKKGSLLKKHLEWVPQFLFVGFLKKKNQL